MTDTNRHEVICRNCGHGREHHRSMGGLTFCAMLISRVPHTLCNCKKFEEADKDEKAP